MKNFRRFFLEFVGGWTDFIKKYDIHSVQPFIHTTGQLIRRETFHEVILKKFEIDTTTKQKQKH